MSELIVQFQISRDPIMCKLALIAKERNYRRVATYRIEYVLCSAAGSRTMVAQISQFCVFFVNKIRGFGKAASQNKSPSLKVPSFWSDNTNAWTTDGVMRHHKNHVSVYRHARGTNIPHNQGLDLFLLTSTKNLF